MGYSLPCHCPGQAHVLYAGLRRSESRCMARVTQQALTEKLSRSADFAQPTPLHYYPHMQNRRCYPAPEALSAAADVCDPFARNPAKREGWAARSRAVCGLP